MWWVFAVWVDQTGQSSLCLHGCDSRREHLPFRGARDEVEAQDRVQVPELGMLAVDKGSWCLQAPGACVDGQEARKDLARKMVVEWALFMAWRTHQRFWCTSSSPQNNLGPNEMDFVKRFPPQEQSILTQNTRLRQQLMYHSTTSTSTKVSEIVKKKQF